MLDTPSYEHINHQLKKAFEERYPSGLDHPVRLVGIFFGRPENTLSKAEVIPHLNYFNLRSGNHIDFFCAGYGRDLPEDVFPDRRFVISLGGMDCYFSDHLFESLRQAISTRTRWRYSGGADLILTNARYDRLSETATLDFTTAVVVNLDQAKADGLFLGTDMFFEKIFSFAENQTGDDPTWGLSDHLGLQVGGSALKAAFLSLVPEAVRKKAESAGHLYVKDINSP